MQDAQNNQPNNSGGGDAPLQPGTPEYDAAMIAKAEAAQNPNGITDAGTTPPEGEEGAGDQLLAGKYKSVEELQKGILNKAGLESMEDLYKALEKGTLGKPPASNDSDNADPGGDRKDGEPKKPESTGNLYNDALAEFEANGELSPETRKSLNDKGIDDAWIDSAIAGRRAEAKAAEDAFYELAGGKESWEAMSQWASQNMKESEITALNNALAGEDAFVKSLAMDKLKSAYERGNNFPPQNQLKGNPGNQAPNVQGYQDHREMVAAMKDPRYNTDATYRAEVQRKAAKSNF